MHRLTHLRNRNILTWTLFLPRPPQTTPWGLQWSSAPTALVKQRPRHRSAASGTRQSEMADLARCDAHLKSLRIFHHNARLTSLCIFHHNAREMHFVSLSVCFFYLYAHVIIYQIDLELLVFYTRIIIPMARSGFNNLLKDSSPLRDRTKYYIKVRHDIKLTRTVCHRDVTIQDRVDRYTHQKTVNYRYRCDAGSSGTHRFKERILTRRLWTIGTGVTQVRAGPIASKNVYSPEDCEL